MSWLEIVAVYFVGMVVCSYAFARFRLVDDDWLDFAAIGWPVPLLSVIICAPFYAASNVAFAVARLAKKKVE